MMYIISYDEDKYGNKYAFNLISPHKTSVEGFVLQ